MNRGQRGRHRWMFNITGLPGWMRLGFSPGWVDRSPTGLPPTAQWLQESGNLPQFQEWINSQRNNAPVYPNVNVQPNVSPPTMSMTNEQEKQILNDQLNFLQAQIEQIRKRLEELKEKE
ncbi:MAG: DUF5320 domain-containing protein [Candidatus Helarchaeota archaeon]